MPRSLNLWPPSEANPATMSQIWRVVLALSLSALAAACSDAPSTKIKGETPVKIGVVGPMSGANTAFGGQLRNGAGQAIEDIDVRGGVLDRQLTLRVVDDRCDPVRAAAIARGLRTEKIGFVVGHFCSAASIAAAPIYGEAQILMITPSSSDPALTDAAAARGADNVFRMVPRDDLQGPALARHILAHEPGRPVALVQDDTAYGKNVIDSTRAALAASGVRPALEETLASDRTDFSELVARLKARNIGVIVFGGQGKEAGLLLLEARRQALEAMLAGGDALATEAFWKVAGAAGDGTIMTSLPDPRELTTAQRAVAGLARFGIDATGYTLRAYAAVEVFAQAAERAHSLASEDIAKALRQGRYDTALGSLSFDEKGDLRDADYAIYVWRGGGYQRFPKWRRARGAIAAARRHRSPRIPWGRKTSRMMRREKTAMSWYSIWR